ncbi:MAG: O-methyltransferase [Actinobacteria bacterium]|nr:O-methyltransferase [Actinomycetota bacterium]NBV90508.1 O-methyltransferase [Actinomycetota bacterium]NBY15272.1 O-methyltransferase [Actinomycetota bacterium]
MAPTDPRVLALHKASWDFAEAWAGEDEPRSKARVRASEIGCPAVSSGAGSVLRLLAAAIDARNVVEIGTGAGISALWLLEGMNPYGVLTSVDSEAEHQLIAKDALAESGVPAKRVRLINGRASEVLDRLTEYAYDIVLISGKPAELESNIESAMTLLRQGGLLIVDRALWSDRVADPAQRDADTVAVRSAVNSLAKHEELVGSLIPMGDGLLVAVRR